MMEQQSAWYPGSSSSVHHSSFHVRGQQWVSTAPYFENSQTASYADQSSVDRTAFGRCTEVSGTVGHSLGGAGGVDMTQNECTPNSSCRGSPALHEKMPLLVPIDCMNADADSTAGVGNTDHRPESTMVPVIKSDIESVESVWSQCKVDALELDGDVQPRLGDSSACNVCGDVVAGFHCGAYVCEACKKFFVRCLKQGVGPKFACSQSESCVITKESRTHCPRCRFLKCIQLGMYRPGGPNLSSEMCHIPCKVCGAPSSGFHFGAITCEGCKGFFRRSVKERDSLKYVCVHGGNCSITSNTRNVCKACRYSQCLLAGMKPDKSRIGRQPNSVKHATFITLCHIKSMKGLMSPDDPFPMSQPKDPAQHEGDDAEANSSCDYTVTTSTTDQRLASERQKKPRRPYRRRTKSAAGTSDGADPVEIVENSPLSSGLVELKTETLSAIECDSNEVLELWGPELEEEFSDWQDQHPTGVPVPQGSQLTGECSSKGSSMCGGCSEEEVSDSLKAGAGGVLPLCESGLSSPSSSQSLQYGFDEVIESLQQAYYELLPILQRPENVPEITAEMSTVDMWTSQMMLFAHQAQATLKFAKKIPGFRTFPLEEQVSMIQVCMFPIVVLVLSLIYDFDQKKYQFYGQSEAETAVFSRIIPPSRLLQQPLHLLGSIIHRLQPDPVEVAFLCSLHLIDSGSQHAYKELLLDALNYYMEKKCGVTDSMRRGHILMCLRDMAATNKMHQEALGILFSTPEFSHLPVPQLFKDTFFDAADGPQTVPDNN